MRAVSLSTCSPSQPCRREKSDLQAASKLALTAMMVLWVLASVPQLLSEMSQILLLLHLGGFLVVTDEQQCYSRCCRAELALHLQDLPLTGTLRARKPGLAENSPD